MTAAVSAAAARPRARVDAGALALGSALAAVCVGSWVYTVRRSQEMAMPAGAGWREGAAFTFAWGVMMAAMMLPSAAPMVLLYRTVSRRLSAGGERAIPAGAFAAVYLGLWLAPGVPIYLAYVAVGAAAAWQPWLAAAAPYLVAGVLAAAGAYQLTAAKHACLRQCESPLGFLTRRWRSGYGATLGLAARHAAYCAGCCWALMAVLVAAGAMSLPWVVTIALVVFAEKVLPGGGRTARVAGALLIALGAAVALRPGLAATIAGTPAPPPMREMPSR